MFINDFLFQFISVVMSSTPYVEGQSGF